MCDKIRLLKNIFLKIGIIMEAQIEKLNKAIRASKRIVFFGGAGVSTESGIPDFRSAHGLYSQRFKYPPEQMLSHRFFEAHTAEFYEFFREKILPLDTVKPNAAHVALARLEDEGRLSAVITQNIDGLHQAAGSKNVLELHGSVWRNYCVGCGKFYATERGAGGRGVVGDSVNSTGGGNGGGAVGENGAGGNGASAGGKINGGNGIVGCNSDVIGGVPRCSCGEIIKPDVVLYGESLNQKTLEDAARYIADADLLIIGGTSLAVYPAAGLVRYFKGGALAIINKSPTQYDDGADILIADGIGKVFAKIE
jgi:NAD-dependent deacetylase